MRTIMSLAFCQKYEPGLSLSLSFRNKNNMPYNSYTAQPYENVYPVSKTLSQTKPYNYFHEPIL